MTMNSRECIKSDVMKVRWKMHVDEGCWRICWLRENATPIPSLHPLTQSTLLSQPGLPFHLTLQLYTLTQNSSTLTYTNYNLFWNIIEWHNQPLALWRVKEDMSRAMGLYWVSTFGSKAVILKMNRVSKTCLENTFIFLIPVHYTIPSLPTY